MQSAYVIQEGPALPWTAPDEGAGVAAIACLARGLAMISGFNCDHQEKTLRELAHEMSTNLTTTARTARTLVLSGYLVQDEITKRYRLGPSVLASAYISERYAELLQITRPYMERLSSITGESVVLAAELDGVPVAVARVVGSLPLKAELPPGRFYEEPTSAIGKIFAAYGSASERKRRGLSCKRDQVNWDAEPLKRELRQVRKAGIAFGVEGRKPDVLSIATPVKTGARGVAACIAVLMPPGRFFAEQRTKVIDALKHETESLIELLQVGEQ
jgi:DNA-binding IclR family transcriptional regulator